MKFSLLALAAAAFAAPTALQARDSICPAEDFDELHRAALLASAAYSGCQGTAFTVNIVTQLDTISETHGFIGYDDTYQRISVVLRGSVDPHDVLEDVDIIPVTPVLSGVNFPEGIEIMKGVYDPWNSIHETVISTVTQLLQDHPGYTLEVAGHSLGGALTYLGHVALAQNFPDQTVISNALAAFAIGNSEFANFGSSQGTLLRRGNNLGDGVPNMWPQNTHYGQEFYGPGVQILTRQCTGEYDLFCSAGDGWFTVDLEHVENSGVVMLLAGCGN